MHATNALDAPVRPLCYPKSKLFVRVLLNRLSNVFLGQHAILGMSVPPSMSKGENYFPPVRKEASIAPVSTPLAKPWSV